jgi:hypothetical protein
MEGTDDGSVDLNRDPREWSSEKVTTFVRELGGNTMKSVSVCVCVYGPVMDLDLGDPGVIERVDDLLRMDGDTTIEH